MIRVYTRFLTRSDAHKRFETMEDSFQPGDSKIGDEFQTSAGTTIAACATGMAEQEQRLMARLARAALSSINEDGFRELAATESVTSTAKRRRSIWLARVSAKLCQIRTGRQRLLVCRGDANDRFDPIGTALNGKCVADMGKAFSHNTRTRIVCTTGAMIGCCARLASSRYSSFQAQRFHIPQLDICLGI